MRLFRYPFVICRVSVMQLLFLLFVFPLHFMYAEARHTFEVRGFHLDLRIQVMKMPALKDLALELSENGINTLLMEWEATYPYEKHRVITGENAYTRKEITGFVKYCNSIGIDVIPLQQSFGHVEYILRHTRYRELREDQKDYSQVNPTEEALCKALFTDLYEDLITTHTSEYIHIGGDETYLLGHSEASRKKAEEAGMGRLYGDYLKMLCDVVVGLGKRPVIWADIALKYPDALELLPEETVLVDWNYGWELDRFGDHGKLIQSGFEIWGAPALRSGPDNYYLTDWQKHMDNIHTFIPQARQLGYKGIVMTSWSTSGIYSPVFESADNITDLYPVRRVYPLSGFRLLIRAYLESLRTESPLAVEEFIARYSKDTYGLNKSQALTFWKALTAAPYEIKQGKIAGEGIDVVSLSDSVRTVLDVLRSLKPLKNKKEFRHYVLMTEIRWYYLQGMLAEAELNKPSFREEDIPQLLRVLKDLPSERIDKEFSVLHRDVLYPSELEKENRLRNHRIEMLIRKLTN